MKAAALLTLLASVTVAAVVPSARACKYCQQAADPVEVMRFQGQGRNAGSFPMDDSLNNLGNGAPTPVATPAAIVTRAAELPRAAVVAAVVPAPVAPSKAPPTAESPRPRPTSVRWADFGLLGLVGAGGLFAWRTRGSARSVVA